VFTVAVLGSNLYLAAFVHLLVAYPDGRVSRTAGSCRRLHARGRRPAAVLMFGFDAHAPTARARSSRSPTRRRSARSSTRSRPGSPSRSSATSSTAHRALARGGGDAPRTLSPLLWSGVVLLILFVGSIGAQSVAGQEGGVSAVLMLLGQIVFASVPFTFLFGLLRDRVARADALGELLVRLGEAPGTTACAACWPRRSATPA
jgi:hypothetical protein